MVVRLSFLVLCALSFASQVFASPPRQVALRPDEPVHTTDSWSYTDCGLPSDYIQIQSIQVTPDPPQPGKDLTLKVVGDVNNVIQEGAYADVVVKLGLIKLLHKRFDVCEEARNANVTLQCPVEPGSYTVEHTVALPREIPRAKFMVSVQGFTSDDEDMLCLNLKVDFMKRPFFKLDW